MLLVLNLLLYRCLEGAYICFVVLQFASLSLELVVILRLYVWFWFILLAYMFVCHILWGARFSASFAVHRFVFLCLHHVFLACACHAWWFEYKMAWDWNWSVYCPLCLLQQNVPVVSLMCRILDHQACIYLGPKNRQGQWMVVLLVSTGRNTGIMWRNTHARLASNSIVAVSLGYKKCYNSHWHNNDSSSGTAGSVEIRGASLREGDLRYQMRLLSRLAIAI